MFHKIVAIEPVNLVPSAEKALHSFAEEVIMYRDIPSDDDMIVSRISDADAVLVSYTSHIGRKVMEKCPNIRYIGMCCSLYSPESANVDIQYASSRGITVTGIRDYGDEGVVEYIISELVRCLHGFGQTPWDRGVPREITGLKVGIVGLGRTGGMIADALHYLGADISYFARSEKPSASAKGYRFLALCDLLATSEAVFCCLNKNTVLLHEAEFEALGNHKILFNTGLSPAWDDVPFRRWLEGDNICYCDSVGALEVSTYSRFGGNGVGSDDGDGDGDGDGGGCGAEYGFTAEDQCKANDRHEAEDGFTGEDRCKANDWRGANGSLLGHPHVRCMKVSSGCTRQAFDRLSKKVLDNIATYLSHFHCNFS